jgi:D-serine deaminase-like pyridoxal phosphate-dependent protein
LVHHRSASRPAGASGPDEASQTRPGAYVFNDGTGLAIRTDSAADVTLWAVATMVCMPAEGHVVLDVGTTATTVPSDSG